MKVNAIRGNIDLKVWRESNRNSRELGKDKRYYYLCSSNYGWKVRIQIIKKKKTFCGVLNVCLYIIWRNIKLALSRLWKFVCILQSLQQPENKFNSYWILIYGYGCVYMWSVNVTQSCLTLCDPMNYSLPGPTVHEILQTRIIEWVAIPFSRGSSQPRDQPQFSGITGGFFTIWATREYIHIYIWIKMTNPK